MNKNPKSVGYPKPPQIIPCEPNFKFGLTVFPNVDYDPMDNVSMQIVLGTHTLNKRGDILITPSCVNALEVNYQIDLLKEELERVRKEALRILERRERLREKSML